MAAVAIAMQVMSRSGKFGPFPVLLVGVVLWACALKSGIHPTLAGLAVGLLLPAQAGSDDLERLEHMVEPFVSRVIVPLFALANAGIVVTGGWSILTNRIALGVFLGLVLGKPIGIMSATLVTRFVTKNTGGELGSSRGLVGFTVLGGVGFTMSLFIAELAFDASERADAAKLGILAASTVAAISGFVLLRRAPAV
jgi:NhaA family Na+:H+ antiporter